MIINNPNESVKWEVVDKSVEYTNKGEDQIVNVVYIFEKV